MPLEIVKEREGTSEVETAIRRGIRGADPQNAGARDYVPLHLALRDDAGEIQGGLYGATIWGWLMIEGLWVADSLRGRGCERHGYRVFAELPGFPAGHTHFHLYKRFDNPDGRAP